MPKVFSIVKIEIVVGYGMVYVKKEYIFIKNKWLYISYCLEIIFEKNRRFFLLRVKICFAFLFQSKFIRCIFLINICDINNKKGAFLFK